MDPIKVDSDSWTGLDPSRRARPGISPSFALNGARLLGGIALFILGYRTATFTQWTELIVPALIAVQGLVFGFGVREWRLAPKEER